MQLLLSLSLILSSQAAEPVEYTLPEVVSLAERFIRDDGSRSLITRSEIETSNARSVGDLLKRTAGLDFSGQSAVAYAFTRGGDSSHTLVYIDGVRMNDPSSPGRAFDFSTLDLNQIESIEVLKGPQSVQFGSDALAGVILIRTRNGDGIRQISLREEAGSRFSNRTSILASETLGRQTRAQLNLSQDSTQWLSSAAAGGGDPDPRQSYNGTLGLQLTPARGLNLDLRTGVDYSRMYLDTAPFSDDPNYIYRARSHRSSLLAKMELTPRNELHLDLSHLSQRREADNPTDPVNAFTYQELYRGQVSTLGAALRHQSDRGEASLGTSLLRETYGQFPVTGVSTRGNALQAGAYGQYRSPWIRSFRGRSGLRHDRHTDLGSQTTWQLGLENQTAPSLVTFVSAGTGYKVPSLAERFDPGYGSAALRPESAFSLEGGQTWSFDSRASTTLTVFRTEYRDLIGFDFATSRVLNVDRARVTGVEWSGNLPIAPLTFRPHLTYLRAVDLLLHEELPRRARWKGGLILNYAASDLWSAEVEALAKSSRLDQPRNPQRAPGYLLLNGALNLRASEHFMLFARGENLLGRDYQDVRGYLSPGRSLFGGFKLSL